MTSEDVAILLYCMHYSGRPTILHGLDRDEEDPEASAPVHWEQAPEATRAAWRLSAGIVLDRVALAFPKPVESSPGPSAGDSLDSNDTKPTTNDY